MQMLWIVQVNWVVMLDEIVRCHRDLFTAPSRADHRRVTRKRHAHRLANASATSIQNEAGENVQNENVRQLDKQYPMAGATVSFKPFSSRNQR